MKKLLSISIVFILACSLLLIGGTRADAMNNESAALLAGAIALFGPPVLNAMTAGAFYTTPVHYSSYPRAYYPVRTEVIYAYPGYRKCYSHSSAYERGWREEWGHKYQRGRWHAWENYRDYDD